MRPRWRKVISDLLDNKVRTILVVLSIAVGVFAIGVLAGTYVIISDDLGVTYAANNPSNMEIHLVDFEQTLLDTVLKMDGVKDAEARRVFTLLVRVPGEKKWTAVDVVALESFSDNQVNLLNSVSGLTIAEDGQILLEKDVLDEIKISTGQTLEIRLQDETVKEIQVAGVVQDSSTGAVDFLSPPLAYIQMEDLNFFNEPDLFNRLFATVEVPGQDDEEHIRTVLADVMDKIEKNDSLVFRSFVSKTHEHPLESTINAVLGILMALGVLIVFLSSSLIANTLSALLNQHLRHIGVMKLIGGQNQIIFQMYFVMLLVFSALSLLIAVPAGGQGAFALAQFVAEKIGFTILGYRFVPFSLALQVAVGVLVPLVAGFVPVIRGSRVTVQKALDGNGTRSGEEADPESGSRFEQFQLKSTRILADRGIRLPRQLLISLRNTFRQRARLALTLFTLTMGGAIFISVFNVRVTLFDYVQNIGNYFLADVTMDFDRPYRLSEIEAYAYQDPRVTHVEGWTFASSEILYPDGSTAENISILGPPADSDLVHPMLVKGRWIQPGDERVLAISEGVYDYYPDLQVGDSIPLKFKGKQELWQIVGIFKFIGLEGVIAYTPYEYIAREQNLANRSFSYRFVTENHDREYQNMMSKELDAYFRDQGFHVKQATPGLSTLDKAAESLDILITFLLIMALLTATVGSMGLTGTMSMNVLERTREIGIMRSIGANNQEIIRMVIVEGLLIGLISFGMAILLAVPFTYLLSAIVSNAVFATPIAVEFTYLGYVIWLGLVFLLSSLASVLPARNAARLTIREVLAYE